MTDSTAVAVVRDEQVRFGDTVRLAHRALNSHEIYSPERMSLRDATALAKKPDRFEVR